MVVSFTPPLPLVILLSHTRSSNQQREMGGAASEATSGYPGSVRTFSKKKYGLEQSDRRESKLLCFRHREDGFPGVERSETRKPCLNGDGESENHDLPEQRAKPERMKKQTALFLNS